MNAVMHQKRPSSSNEPSTLIALLLPAPLPLPHAGVIRISKQTKLNHALDVCKKNHVHMLVVSEGAAGLIGSASGRATSILNDSSERISSTSERISSTSQRAPSMTAGFGPAIGVATVEDFLEEILQEEIVDETDVYVDNQYSTRSRDEVSDLRVSQTRSRSSLMSDRDSVRSSMGDSPSVGRHRLNSKHFDTTVVLRSISVRASTVERPSMMPRASTAPGDVDVGVDLGHSERASQQSTADPPKQPEP